jgi:hypothetical protein
MGGGDTANKQQAKIHVAQLSHSHSVIPVIDWL